MSAAGEGWTEPDNYFRRRRKCKRISGGSLKIVRQCVFIIVFEIWFAEEFNKEYKIARVSKGGKWGVINDKGTDIVPISFDEVIICADGYIYVKRGDKCGVYSSKGDIVCPVECDDRGLYNSKSIMFKHGIAKVMLNGHSVKLDSFGNIISLYTDK